MSDNATPVRLADCVSLPDLGRVLLLVLCLVLALPVFAQPAQVEVQVSGVDGLIRETVRAHLSLLREQGHPLLTDLRVQRLHGLAPDEIRRALEAFGYYEPGIDAQLTRENGVWQARYRIQPGAPVRITAIDIELRGEGRDDPLLVAWREAFPLREGDILEHRPYESAKDELFRRLRSQGYVEAELVTHRILVNPGQREARIELAVESGPRYRFGEVTFAEVPLREAFLRRFLTFEPGEPYDVGGVLDLQRVLAASDYFETVDVDPRETPSAEREVPVEVRLRMRPRDRYTAGLGYGTDTGPRLRLGWDRRWVNPAGHRANVDLLVSEIRRTIGGTYEIPLDEPQNNRVLLSGLTETEETDVAERTTSQIGAALSQQLGRWQRTTAITYQSETFVIGDIEDRSQLLYPSLGYQRIEAPTRIFPNWGWRVAADVRGASEAVLSTTNLVQGQLHTKSIFSTLGGRLIARAQLGATEARNFDEVPVSLRFFAGGDRSVRGYAYQSLAPEVDGNIVGGRHLLVGSLEFDRYETDQWGWAVFFDAGDAFNNTNAFQFNRGAGVGLRYLLPFGAIRLDVASALDRPGRPTRLHLTVGPDL